MAKFLKSIFHTSDRKKSQYEHDAEEERSESPQPGSGSRRQLSISRSGRMKQANKKRHSLTLELYGDGVQIDTVEKPTSMEYHVHTPSQTAPADLGDMTRIEDISRTEDIVEKSTEIVNSFDVALQTKLNNLDLDKSPEEEIDNAFEVIDKS